jgi:hypothetical protein
MEKIESQIRQLVRGAPLHTLIRDKRYLYFPLQNTQEDITFKSLKVSPFLPTFEVKNQKGLTIGYGVELLSRPAPHVSLTEFGAAVFFSKGSEYKSVEVVFHDQRLRIVRHGDRDFWISVKWKGPQAKDTE